MNLIQRLLCPQASNTIHRLEAESDRLARRVLALEEELARTCLDRDTLRETIKRSMQELSERTEQLRAANKECEERSARSLSVTEIHRHCAYDLEVAIPHLLLVCKRLGVNLKDYE